MIVVTFRHIAYSEYYNLANKLLEMFDFMDEDKDGEEDEEEEEDDMEAT